MESLENARSNDAGPRVRSVWTDGLGRTAVRGAQLTLVAIPAALAVVVLVRLRLVVVPAVVAVLIAAAVWPLVGWLRGRGLPPILAAWTALLTGAAVLGGLGWLVVVGIRDEWDELRLRADEGLRELERLIASDSLPIDAEQIDRARAAALGTLQGQGVGARAAGGAVLVAEIVAGIVLAVVILFFLLKDGPRIWGFFRRAFPTAQHGRLDRIAPGVLDVLGGYVRGTTVVAFVDAVLIGVALALLGVPLALPLAVLVFLGAFVPLLGAVLAGAFAALVALVANGPVVALIVVAVVIAVNQIEGDVLAPLVLGRAVALHPLAVLLALTAGTILAGIIGALLAVPAVAAIWSVMRGWNEAARPV